MRSAVGGPLGVERLPLQEAAGRALAEPLIATAPYPVFDNSAMDGYVVGRAEDAEKGTRLRLAGEVPAGSPPPSGVEPGTAIRILTGAPTPAGAFGVVMQEDVEVSDGWVVLNDGVREGAHIRRRGDDFTEGEELLQAGALLNPGALALLASQGIVSPATFMPPSCAVLTTGDELVPPSQTPGPGQIRETNGVMLTRLALEAGARIGEPPHPLQGGDAVTHLKDDQQETESALAELAERNDLVIVAGGVSVGDRDLIPGTLGKLGEIHFHGVRIKPGRPVLLGRIGKCWLFGLPGNPGSAFVCFHIFVREAIVRLAGHANPEPLWLPVRLMDAYKSKNRDEFLRCRILPPRLRERAGAGGALPEAHIVREQGSFGLRSLAEADCIVRIPADTDHGCGHARSGLLL